MVEYYYQDQLRWSFGFENPNKAAALIASLLPLLWLVAQMAWRIKRPGLKWPTVALGSASLCAGWWLLFMTFSRGGIVAAAVGFVYIGWRERALLFSRWSRARLSVAVVTFLAVAALFAGTNAAGRSTQWVTEREGSVVNRFEIWRGGLEMIAEIPQGVGRGQSGAFYMQWFQPLNSTTRYRTLVNSYLTFAVEQGVAVFTVTFFSALALWFGTSRRSSGGVVQTLDIGLRASLLSFATAAFFSTTMEEWKLWIVPGGCFLVLAITAICSRNWHAWLRGFGLAGATSIALSAVLYGCGWDALGGKSLRVTVHGEQVQITPESKNPRLQYHVWSDASVLGEDSGKLLRRLALERNAMVTVGGNAGSGNEILVVAGDAISRVSHAENGREWILIAPGIIDENVAAEFLRTAKSALLFVPSFDDDGRVAFWNSIQGPKSVKRVELDGVGSQIEWAWEPIIQHL